MTSMGLLGTFTNIKEPSMKTLAFLFLINISAFAVNPDQKTLPIDLAPYEAPLSRETLPVAAPPIGPIHSLAEWEKSEGVMVLWTNPSLVRALQKNGNVKLFSDDRSSQSWWENWLKSNGISDQGVSYFRIPTDSIWIRDYGPWFILDGNSQLGIVHSKYNRPRPTDDQVASRIAQIKKIPYYPTGLVHTGGNYYNDGMGNAFSSTLVFSENSSLSKDTVLTRMKDFLGIERYTTSELGKKITIEHMDTFGKLVSPDTWVFSDFPANSKFKKDSDQMVKMLSQMKSPNGNPYRIFRMKMTLRPGSSREDYRAYINSFISNHAVYYPTYGDAIDQEAKAVYEAALPGYEVVGVDGRQTEWGDSVHCRTRNLLTRETVFLFPKMNLTKGTLEIQGDFIATPGEKVTEVTAYLRPANTEEAWEAHPMTAGTGSNYSLKISDLKSGDKLNLYLEATDSKDSKASYPRFAPRNLVELVIP